ncbi:MAG: DedA family protein [Magnetospirillum sp. WYHS-4]
MLRRVYDWVMALAAHRHAVWWLAAISFIESSLFPIPPDVMLIPMILAVRERAWWFASVCTVSSVVGGYLGYAIGYFLYETLGLWVIKVYGLAEKFEGLRKGFEDYGTWIILIKGATPIPYKLITIAAGVFHFDLTAFTFASIGSRGFRFFLVAILLWYFGPIIRDFVERRLMTVTTIGVILLVGGFVVVKYLI